MSEVVPTIQEGMLGYTHSFSRYFELDGQRHDRQALIEEHGILAPAEARRRKIPFKVNVRVIFEGVPDYDEYIFVFPVRDKRNVPAPFGSVVLLEPNLPVLSPEDMHRIYGNNWAVMSRIFGGEFYVPQRIDQRYFR